MDNKYGRLFDLQDMLAFARILQDSDIDINNGDAVNEVLDNFEGQFPTDEPLFLLRGKDKRALSCVRNYKTMISFSGRAVPDVGLIAGVEAAVRYFERFAQEHPERMKDPD